MATLRHAPNHNKRRNPYKRVADHQWFKEYESYKDKEVIHSKKVVRDLTQGVT
jgi:hypothetical protein